MPLSIRSDNNDNFNLPSQNSVSTKEEPKFYDNNINNEDKDYFR